MNLLHQQVLHPRFGVGEITGQSRQQVSVCFSTSEAVRRFLYPAAFFGHLTLCDPGRQAQLEAELAQSLEAADFLRRRELARSIRRTETERLRLMGQRRATVRRQLPAHRRTALPSAENSSS